MTLSTSSLARPTSTLGLTPQTAIHNDSILQPLVKSLREYLAACNDNLKGVKFVTLTPAGHKVHWPVLVASLGRRTMSLVFAQAQNPLPAMSVRFANNRTVPVPQMDHFARHNLMNTMVANIDAFDEKTHVEGPVYPVGYDTVANMPQIAALIAEGLLSENLPSFVLPKPESEEERKASCFRCDVAFSNGPTVDMLGAPVRADYLVQMVEARPTNNNSASKNPLAMVNTPGQQNVLLTAAAYMDTVYVDSPKVPPGHPTQAPFMPRINISGVDLPQDSSPAVAALAHASMACLTVGNAWYNAYLPGMPNNPISLMETGDGIGALNLIHTVSQTYAGKPFPLRTATVEDRTAYIAATLREFPAVAIDLPENSTSPHMNVWRQAARAEAAGNAASQAHNEIRASLDLFTNGAWSREFPVGTRIFTVIRSSLDGVFPHNNTDRAISELDYVAFANLYSEDPDNLREIHGLFHGNDLGPDQRMALLYDHVAKVTNNTARNPKANLKATFNPEYISALLRVLSAAGRKPEVSSGVTGFNPQGYAFNAMSAIGTSALNGSIEMSRAATAQYDTAYFQQ